MSTKPFELGRTSSKPSDWINSTIDIAVSLLKHRLEILERTSINEFNVNDQIYRELLGRTIWKYSEAYGKFKGCPFWSKKAYNFFNSLNNLSSVEISKNLRHEHTYPQILLINKLRELKDPGYEEVKSLFQNFAIATVVTKEENDKLNSKEVGLRSKTLSDKNIWLRYSTPKLKILIKENPLKADFFEFHKNDIMEAGLLVK